MNQRLIYMFLWIISDVRYYRGRHSPLISNNIGNLCLTFDPVMIREQEERVSGALKLQFVASTTCSIYTDYRPYQGLLHLLNSSRNLLTRPHEKCLAGG